MSSVVLRNASPSDVSRLAVMNGEAYPELVEDGVVFDEAQLRAHLAVFPRGQLVAEIDGEVVGAMATLVVPGAAALAEHDWIGITSFGTFASHDPSGDTLYLADVYTDPSVRGRGVGKALYAGLFGLCRRLGLRRVVAGGRLFGYHDVAAQMSIAQYVEDVKQGARRDRVLSSQLQAGFEVRGILTGYLEDWRSGSFATHLVWPNPEHPMRVTLPASLSQKPSGGA